MFTVELLGSQQLALKEKEMTNIDLLRRVDALSAEKREVDEKLTKLYVDLNRKLVIVHVYCISIITFLHLSCNKSF